MFFFNIGNFSIYFYIIVLILEFIFLYLIEQVLMFVNFLRYHLNKIFKNKPNKPSKYAM
jgi:hypothetical protein